MTISGFSTSPPSASPAVISARATGTPDDTDRASSPITLTARVASRARAAASSGRVIARPTRSHPLAEVFTLHSVVCSAALAATRARPGIASSAVPGSSS